VTADHAVERLAKVRLEDGVEDRIDGGVDVPEPEEERVQSAWDAARRAPAVDDVNREEAEPRSAQNGHYDGRSDCSSRLDLFGVAHPPPPAKHETQVDDFKTHSQCCHSHDNRLSVRH